ncbi:unnamed protein product [Lupinus luteus]|uniref:Uncharacterized protein n=1 Tax=Lupinus luteus TaxID=3873 RepID=A0AAV1X6T6_LUPLU
MDKDMPIGLLVSSLKQVPFCWVVNDRQPNIAQKQIKKTSNSMCFPTKQENVSGEWLYVYKEGFLSEAL